MRVYIVVLLALGLAAVEAIPASSERIVGGSLTTISNYPNLVGLLFTGNWVTYTHSCGGAIINTRAVLTAAHCVVGDPALRWRLRVGATFANSAGTVHTIERIVTHGAYNFAVRYNNDIATVRSSTAFTFNNFARPSFLAGSNYNLPDNASVWVAGWGRTSTHGSPSEQLRHVEILTVNFQTCRNSYGSLLTDSMMCAGLFNAGGRGPCIGDSGGPLLHNGVVVGIVSWGSDCGAPRFPAVFTRVSLYQSWITNNL